MGTCWDNLNAIFTAKHIELTFFFCIMLFHFLKRDEKKGFFLGNLFISLLVWVLPNTEPETKPYMLTVFLKGDSRK